MSTDEPGRGRWPGASARRPPWARAAGIVLTGVWLFYLVQPIADLLTRHYRPPYVAGGVLLLVVFATVYLVVVPEWPMSPRHSLAGLGALTLLAVLFCVFYGPVGGSGIWIFVTVAAGLEANRRWALLAVVGSIGCYLLFSATTHDTRTDFLTNLLPVVFLGFAMMALRQHFALTAQLDRAREEIAQLAASEERLRLARDMHDLTGQSLSVITLKSELAARLLARLPASADRDRARDEIDQVAAVSRQTLRDIREAISGYRRPTLAVEIITARSALASAGITAHDDDEFTLLSGAFDRDAEAVLAWCLREAATNVVRHSGADNCRLSLARSGESLIMTIRDDGAGYAADGTTNGSGLRGMSERLSAVGGSLTLRPDAGPGFCLVATVPTVPAVGPAVGPAVDPAVGPAGTSGSLGMPGTAALRDNPVTT
jgi:two-component system sensor histidine kinase DesK